MGFCCAVTLAESNKSKAGKKCCLIVISFVNRVQDKLATLALQTANIN